MSEPLICGACDGTGEAGYIGSRARPCRPCRGTGEVPGDEEAEAEARMAHLEMLDESRSER